MRLSDFAVHGYVYPGSHHRSHYDICCAFPGLPIVGLVPTRLLFDLHPQINPTRLLDPLGWALLARDLASRNPVTLHILDRVGTLIMDNLNDVNIIDEISDFFDYTAARNHYIALHHQDPPPFRPRRHEGYHLVIDEDLIDIAHIIADRAGPDANPLFDATPGLPVRLHA